MKRKKLIIVIIAIVCLIVLGLVAAFAFVGPKVTGVKSLVAANMKAQTNVDSYHVDGTVDMTVTFDPDKSGTLQDLLGKVDPKLPVKMTMDMDAGTETAHVTTDASISVFGKTVPVQTAEVYLDLKKMVSYTRTGDSVEWKKSGDEDQEVGFKEMAGGLAIVGKTVAENAVFEETEDFYTLTMQAETAGEFVADLDLFDWVDLGVVDVRDITVEGGQIVYNVDKTTLLVSSIELKDVDLRGRGTYKGVSMDLQFPTDASFQFSRYNELEESEYAIPAEVLNGE
ncbi:MAG: hypothetical protein IJI74_02090 [Firmicutes bacterium]|nr:hypothetical protein [Bacillota bacterium]